MTRLAAALLLALALATPAQAAPAWRVGLLSGGQGVSWWYATGCAADPVVETIPPGLGGGHCSEGGTATAYANAGWSRVTVDGVVVGERVWLPGVAR